MKGDLHDRYLDKQADFLTDPLSMDDSLDLEQMDRHSTVDLSLLVARNFDQTKAVEFLPVKRAAQRLAIDDEVFIIEEAVG